MKLSETRTPHPVLSFLAVLVIFEIVGGVIGWISGPGLDGWYGSLIRSPLNPPGAVFGIVWPILYFLLAFSYWSVRRLPATQDRAFLLRLFALHMILNWLWSPLFFIGHHLFASFALILALIFTGSMLLWLLWPLDRKASLAFVPYLGCLTFAGHLAHYIWHSNPG